MSISGQIPQSDSLYPIEALYAVTKLEEWLNDKKEDTALQAFFAILGNMESQTEFQPSYCSNEPKPAIAGGVMEYRKPVWGFIAVSLEGLYPHHLQKTESAMAGWLRQIMREAFNAKRIADCIANFNANLELFGATLSINDPTVLAGVRLSYQTGQEQRQILSSVVGKLKPVLEAHIKNRHKA